MRKNLLILAAAMLGVLAAGGCQPKYTEPQAGTIEPMTPEQQQFDRLWQASRRVLTRYEFHIDRQDPRSGVMTTWPMVGKQMAELWRRDAAGANDALESTVQTLYRSVKVTIRKTDTPAGYEPIVEVFVSRSDKTANTVSTTSDAYNLFTKRPKKRKLTPEQEAATLVDLGNDRGLETKLRLAILKEAGK